MQRAKTASRAAIGALLSLLIVAGVAGPSFAAPPPPDTTKIAGTSIAGAHAEVNPGTPLYSVEIVFTGIAGVNCTTLAGRGAKLYWKIDTTGRGVASNPGSRGGKTGILDLCPTGTVGPVTTGRFTMPVFGGGFGLYPNEQLDVGGDIRYGDSSPTNAQLSYPAIVRGTDDVTMPLAPVWVGIGDGYTSATVQTPAVCPFSDTTCSSPTTLNQSAESWVAKAVQKLNTTTSANDGWEITFVPVALNGTRSADLLPGTSQLNQLTARLSALAPSVGSKRPGSWNWVGVTAGIVDSGIIDALQNQVSGWYSRTANSLATSGTSPNPWDVTAAINCPTLTGVPTQVSNNLTAIQDGILNVYAAALAADPNVRIVHPLYPYFAESTDNGGYTNPCFTQTKNAVDALDGALSLTGLATRAATRGVDLSHAFDVDLRPAFGAHPTGERQTDGSRVSSAIQLTKPWGFPYPSGSGATKMASSVINVIKGQEDATPPVQRAELSRTADSPSSGWYNQPVDIIWRAFDPASDGDLADVRTTTVDTEGYNWNIGPADQCSPISDLCASPIRQAAPLDMTPPTAGFRVTDAAGAAMTANANGWFNKPATIYWAFTDNPGGAGADFWSALDTASVPTGAVSTLSNAKDQTFTVPANTMCDLAGNCALVSVPVSVDTIAPVVTGGTVPGTPVSGWFNASSPTSIGVRWTSTDNLSGIDGADVLNGTIDATSSGTFTAAGPVFTDKAGNATTGSPITIKVDRVAPVVSLTGGATSGTLETILSGVEYTAATLPKVFGCSATDALSGIKGTCSAVLKDSTALPGGLGTSFTYTVTATDQAGNVTTQDVTFTGLGVTNTVPPTVTGTVSRPPNSDGWYNQPVTITWSYEEGSPSAGISSAAKTAFNNVKTVVVSTDGKNVKVSSPVICDLKNQCSTVVTKTIKLDQVKPTITIQNVTQGATYTRANTPTPTCSGTDALSGFKSCSISSSYVSLPAYGPPGKAYTVTATGTDYAGNVGTTTITYTVFDVTPVASGRMTGSGKISGSSTEAEFTLRCNGSPNQLDVEWSGGSFDMDTVTSVMCWDDSRYDEGQPNAPIDSLWMKGTGKLKNGQPATIEFTLTDQGEPGCGRDTLSFVIKDANGNVVLSSSGKLTGGGNVQAHDATGEGTNNNGHVNGPNGHYDSSGYDHDGYDRDGYDRDGYDHDGYDRDGCDKRGYDRSGRRQKSSWNGYDRSGRDDDGYDRNGYDRSGYNRSGYNKSGYDDHGYDREGRDRDGCDRNGYDARGSKRKSGSRR